MEMVDTLKKQKKNQERTKYTQKYKQAKPIERTQK